MWNLRLWRCVTESLVGEPSSCILRDCRRCPRLVALRKEVRASHPDYFAAPVPAWGRKDARMLIVGLAPGRHGANRTGRPFTGDASGDFLFRAMHRTGFASAPDAADARLNGVRITNAVKCLPPQNRPVAGEVASCRSFLVEEIASLLGMRPRRPRLVLCLGRLAHEAVVRALAEAEIVAAGNRGLRERLPEFRHGQAVNVRSCFHLLDTYHPSRQNTNTGRLTSPMLDEVFMKARWLLDAVS